MTVDGLLKFCVSRRRLAKAYAADDLPGLVGQALDAGASVKAGDVSTTPRQVAVSEPIPGYIFALGSRPCGRGKTNQAFTHSHDVDLRILSPGEA